MIDEVEIKANKSKMPLKLSLGLLIGCAGWMGPYIGLAVTLLPAKIGQLAPSSKVSLVATFSAVAMVVATIANIVNGALSDRTRSRFGKRTPWIVGGSLISAGLFYAISVAPNIPVLLTLWALYQVSLNAVVAPLVAIIADKVNPKFWGTVSSFYGVGAAMGNYGSGVIAARFLGGIQIGIWLFALIGIVFAIISVILIKEPSNKDEPRETLHGKELLQAFIFPIHDARDFYLALVGKLLMVTGQYVIVGYQLYIFTDYMKLNQSETANSISAVSMILMVTGIVFAAFAGPLVDKIGRLKLPVALTTVMLGVGAFFPFFEAKPWTMIVYAVIAGIGMGAYNSVDQALNVAVLPDPKTAAKDLGVINLANTLGQVAGPIISGIIISMVGYHMIFPVETIICVIGGGLIMMIKRVK